MATTSLRAEPATCEDICRAYIETSEKEIKLLKDLRAKDGEYIEILVKQRNEANGGSLGLPWWIWAAFGAAGAIVLIRGVK